MGSIYKYRKPEETEMEQTQVQAGDMNEPVPFADIKLKELASYTDTQTNYYEIRITGTKTLTIDNAGIVAITGNGNMAAGGSVLQADVL